MGIFSTTVIIKPTIRHALLVSFEYCSIFEPFHLLLHNRRDLSFYLRESTRKMINIIYWYLENIYFNESSNLR